MSDLAMETEVLSFFGLCKKNAVDLLQRSSWIDLCIKISLSIIVLGIVGETSSKLRYTKVCLIVLVKYIANFGRIATR